MIIMGPNQKKEHKTKGNQSIMQYWLFMRNEIAMRDLGDPTCEINTNQIIIHSWESHSQSQELVVHFQQKEFVVVHIEIVIVALWKLREAWRAKRVNLSILCTTTFNTLLALQPSKTLKFCFLYVPFVIHFQRVLTVAFLSQRLSLSLSLSLWSSSVLFPLAIPRFASPFSFLIHSKSFIFPIFFFTYNFFPFLEKKN